MAIRPWCTGEKLVPESPYQSIFILGGASSGKSAFAQRLASSLGERVVFVATAWPSDEEMAARITRHQAERPSNWQVIERPRFLAEVVEAIGDAEVVLFDSLSLWLAGLLPDDEAGGEQMRELEGSAALEVRRLFDACAGRCHLLVVSDELGMGVVPPYPLGRRHREVLGRLNQSVAAVAGTVYLVVAGLPVVLKGHDAGAAQQLL